MFNQAGRGAQQLPEGVVVASYSAYDEAQAAVTKVGESDAPVAGLAIVGSGLTLVERVTGKLSYGRVALRGMSQGLMMGLFIGLVYLLMIPDAARSFLLFPALGAAFGILLGVVTHSMTRRRRDFASVQQVVATSYDVIAPHETAGRAMQIIGQRSSGVMTHQAPPPAAPAAAPAAPETPDAPVAEPAREEPPAPHVPVAPEDIPRER